MRLIYLSPVPWHSFSQRPQELVRYFHLRTGGDVLWIDPYPTRLPRSSDFLHKRPVSRHSESSTPDWITVIKPRALPLEALPFSGTVNALFWRAIGTQVERFADRSTVLGIGKPSELALQLLGAGGFLSSFYDAMDDFPAFYTGFSRAAMARREYKTACRVTTVLTSSSELERRLVPLAKDVRLVLNACAVSRLPLRVPLRSKKAGRPIIGYVGTIAGWFDWKIVLALATQLPDADFRIIGPQYERPPEALPANIILEPAVPHSEAVKAMSEFDVGLIPFKQSELTSSVDPIKYYEYRALGLPVLSTAFGEMALRSEQEGVWLINHDSDMSSVAAEAIAYAPEPSAIDAFRQLNSWESRFDAARIFSA